jgi:hypothetical protein
MGALIGLLAFKLIHTLLTACFPPLRSQHQQAHEQHQPGQDVWAAIRAAHATAEGDALALAQDQSLNTETATTTATDLGLQDIVPMEEVLETGIGGRTEHARSTDGFGVMEDVGMDGVEEGRGSIEELVRRGQEMARVLQMVGGFTDEELEAERERRRRVMPSWI